MRERFYRVALAAVLAGFTLSSIFCHAASKTGASRLPAERKEVPEITFANLTPPFLDYAYFEGSGRHPFQFDAEGFSLVNAWWLAEASTLAYADEDFVRPRFAGAGLPAIKFFNGLSTQCYAASNDKFAVIAFRGSEIWKTRDTFELKKVLADLKTDIDFRLSDWPAGGKVHQGFKQALDEIWPELLPHLARLESRGCRIWVTGHSLGAALATLCGARYGRVQGVYGFGSPKVGDDAFRRQLNVGIYRIVNNDDIVPRLFIPGPYVHVGVLEFIGADGTLYSSPPRHEKVFPTAGEADGQNGSTPSAQSEFKGFVPPAFRDHVPLLYTVHLWNNLIENEAPAGGTRR